MSKQAFSLDAMVVLPDHLHCIWTLPPEDSDFATRWRLIKTWFTKHCDTSLHRQSDNARMLRGERTSWQRRYWEHLLRDENDFNHHVDYIHYNPVRHGYVTRVIDWPYSSFRRYVNSGILPEDWGSGGIDLPESVGHE
jgi:putative transposase